MVRDKIWDDTTGTRLVVVENLFSELRNKVRQ
jgi:hypothetical protein